MRPSPAASSASAVGEVATSCGICVRNDQLVASADRLPARSWIAAETSIVYSEPGRRPNRGKRRTEWVSSSYVGAESCASGVVPRRISKLSPTMVSGSMASEKVILISPTETDIPSAAMAGVAPVTVGRVVSRERTSTISKTSMALPLASTAPITCKVPVPEGISAPTVNSPLHDVPVNCNSSKSKVSAPITIWTVTAVLGSTPECSSRKPRARVVVWPIPNSVRLKLGEPGSTTGETVSMIK